MIGESKNTAIGSVQIHNFEWDQVPETVPIDKGG